MRFDGPWPRPVEGCVRPAQTPMENSPSPTCDPCKCATISRTLAMVRERFQCFAFEWSTRISLWHPYVTNVSPTRLMWFCILLLRSLGRYVRRRRPAPTCGLCCRAFTMEIKTSIMTPLSAPDYHRRNRKVPPSWLRAGKYNVLAEATDWTVRARFIRGKDWGNPHEPACPSSRAAS